MDPTGNPSLIGREELLLAVGERLDAADASVVTLRGPGGVGKTTLARQLSDERSAPFVALEVCRDPGEIAAAVGEALRLPDPKRNIEGIGAELSDAHVPFVALDNAEHVLDAVAEVLAAWGDTPTRFLVTSREAIGLSGEDVVEVGPLAVDEAMHLFELRARRVTPGFAIDDANREDVRRLVEQVDGLPLALELAAARMNIMTPTQVVERLDAQFDVLRDRTSRLERHAMLDACVEWSWDLLEPGRRSVLRQAAIFRGPFLLAEAEAVIESSEWVGDAIEALVDRSLVRVDRRGDEPRFALYDSVRRFVDRRTDVDDALVHRYATFLLERALGSPLRHRDLSNIVHAFGLAIDRDPALAIELLVEARARLWRSGFVGRVFEMLDRALDVDDLDPMWEGAVRCALAASHYTRMDFDAMRAELERAAALVDDDERTPAVRTRAHVALLRAVHADEQQRLDEAEPLYDEARRHTDAMSPSGETHLLAACGLAALRRGRLMDAIADFEASIHAAKRSGDNALIARTLSWSANAYIARGQTHHAIDRLEEALEVHREDDVTSRAVTEYGLAQALITDDPERALTMARRARASGEESGVAILEAMASVLVARLDAGEESADTIRCQLQLFDENSGQNERWSAWVSLLVVLVRNDALDDALAEAERMTAVADRVATDAEQRSCRRYLTVLHTLQDGSPTDEDATADPEFVTAIERAIADGHVDEEELARFDEPYMRYAHDNNPGPLELLDERLRASRRQLHLLDDGARVRLPDGSEIDLESRYVLRRLFRGMCEARVESPGEDLTLEELIEIGWPDEAMTYESGTRRVYSAIRNLRKLGLDDVILTGEDGYHVDPDLELVRDEIRS